ncbi:MAG: hypothetical protein JWQ06_2297 [Mucilaginibacter sp.]|nr:hypothetical protein [Mucilaginibacter sp.]
MFSYLYRDSSNYKNYGFVIFANPDNIDLAAVEDLIRSKLIYDTWFYANEWHLPDLRFANLDLDNDPTWHEFESVEFTDERVNATCSLDCIT